MSLIIASGSNLKNKINNLLEAKRRLEEKFNLIAFSNIYKSKAQDYQNQPDFYNQVLEFETPLINPKEILEILLDIEKDMGRIRTFLFGPRIIDLDIIFLGLKKVKEKKLTIPHPRIFERSFVVLPLKELPYYKQVLKHKYTFPKEFTNMAIRIKS